MFGRRLLVAVAAAAVLSGSATFAGAARAAGPYTLLGQFPGGSDVSNLELTGAFYRWSGKSDAIVNVYGNSIEVQNDFLWLWQRNHVPMLSYWLPGSTTAVAAGAYDGVIGALAAQIKNFLAGPNHIYGNADDRRAYIRPAWESNVGRLDDPSHPFPWSPCNPGAPGRPQATPESYKAAWQHIHDIFTDLGIDNTRLAWVFSVNEVDFCPQGAPELLYPGNEYVDWVGIDGYNWGEGVHPAQVFDGMATRLENITGHTKPLSINEVSTDPVTIDRSQWITEYFDYIHNNPAHDFRMSLWFNADKELPWAIFGGSLGDEVYTDCCTTPSVYNAYSAYRQAIQASWVIGARSPVNNPRLMTDARFLGQ